MVNDSSSSASITSFDFTLQISGTTKVIAQNGIYTFDSVMLVA